MMKVVRFSADVTDFHTLSRSEYSLWELQQCFYTSKEKKQHWSHQNKAVTRFEKGKPEANDQVHRGLEPMTDKGYQLIIQMKNKCVDAVMDEQEEQWRSGIVDWVRMAKASQQISNASIVIAIKMAKRDEQQANKAYLQMNRPRRPHQSHQLASAASASASSNIVDADNSSLTDGRSTRSTGRMTGNKYTAPPYSHRRHHHHYDDDDGCRKRNPTTTTCSSRTGSLSSCCSSKIVGG